MHSFKQTHSSVVGSVFHAVEHGAEFSEPFAIDSSHVLHVLLAGHDKFVVDNVVGSETHAE